MDQNDTMAPSDVGRSAEELAWDEEFRDIRESNSFTSTVGELAKLVVKAPVVLVQMPMSLLPQETRRHARAAARESFLALRSFFGAIADGIEEALAEPSGDDGAGTVQGPEGTWGHSRQAGTYTATPSITPSTTSASSAPDSTSSTTSTTPTSTPGSASGSKRRKSQRIEVGEETLAEGSGSTDAEGRGLRADIQY